MINMNSSTYRPDIDGLRAIAVVAVILFHSGIPGFYGGFVGVDIFFVISGYLITTILWKEIQKDRFSIARFYERRIRRILPALLCCMATCLLVGVLILLPFDLIGLAKSSVAALSFLSNIYFWRSTGYFDQPAELKPLLHTWSLGIEEQFYIFFPVILVILGRFAEGRVKIILSILTLASLLASIFGIALNKSMPTFYLLPTRAWELFVGSLLAVGIVPAIRDAGMRTICASAGLLCIAGAVGFYWATMPFPGAAALLPCIGAALLIAAGRDGPHSLTPALSAKPVVAVGLISYSLYLVHWPILVFLKYYLVRPLTALETACSLLLMFILAWLSWRYVERPVRQGMPLRRMLWLLGGSTLAIVAVSGMLIAKAGLPTRFSREAAAINAAAGTIYKCNITDYFLFAQYYACPLNLPSGNPADAQIALWGDSHAQMYAPAVLDALKSAALPGMLIPLTGCPPTVANVTVDCSRINTANLKAVLRAPEIKTVILGLRWQSYRNSTFVSVGGDTYSGPSYEALNAQIISTVSKLRAAGKRVILIGPIALPEYDFPSLFSRSLAFERPMTHPLYQDRASFDADLRPVLGMLDMLDRQPLVDVIYVHERQCDRNRCRYAKDGYSLFADDNHLSASYAASLSDLFAARIKDGSENPAGVSDQGR